MASIKVDIVTAEELVYSEDVDVVIVPGIDGEMAIEVFRRAKDRYDPFDLVILDLTIPGGMGGKETIKKIIETDPYIKAIVASGYSNDPVMSNHEEFGFSGVISKPYKAQDLINIVLRTLNQRN